MKMTLGFGIDLSSPNRGGGAYVDPYANAAYPTYPATTMFDITRKAQANNSTNVSTAVSDVTSDGADAIRITVPTSDVVISLPAVGAPMDMSGFGSIVVSFKPIANCNTLNRFNIELVSDASIGSANSLSVDQFNTASDVGQRVTGATNISSSTSLTTPGRWQRYSVAIPQIATVLGAGATLSAIRGVRVRLRSTGGAAIIEGLKIEYVPNPRTKAACLISFDDAYESHYINAFPMLQAYGFPGILLPSPAQTVIGAPGKLTMANLLEMQAAGWQIGGQAWSTEDAATFHALGDPGMTNDLAQIKPWQVANGLRGYMHGSHFANVNHWDALAFSAFQQFRSARPLFTPSSSPVPALRNGETFPFGDRLGIRAVSAATWGANTGSMLTAMVDQTIANKGVMYIGLHDELAGGVGNIPTGMATLLAYLDANRASIEVLTERTLLFPA